MTSLSYFYFPGEEIIVREVLGGLGVCCRH